MDNKVILQFFSLLRSGLWDIEPDLELFSKTVDWKSILVISEKQTVIGVVFDGILKLPSEMQPPQKLMHKLVQYVIQIEQSHELLNKQLVDVVPKMQAEGIQAILLKGQGVAQNYPNPIRRQCGDIDLFVGEQNCVRAMELLVSLGADPDNKTQKKSPKHESFYLNKVNIELHFLIEKLRNPIFNKRFQAWSKDHLKTNNLNTWTIAGVNISLPPIDFNALYIFNHAYHHFIAGGIGLRQLCDWALFLYKYNHQINKDRLLKTLKDFGLLKPWQVFGCILVKEIGLSKDDFPFYAKKYNDDSRKVLNLILEVGNFGEHTTENRKHPSGYLTGKLHSLYIKQKYLLKILPVFPRDVLTFYVWYWGCGITNILKGW